MMEMLLLIVVGKLKILYRSSDALLGARFFLLFFCFVLLLLLSAWPILFCLFTFFFFFTNTIKMSKLNKGSREYSLQCLGYLGHMENG